MLLSIVIPVYNTRPEYIKECLHSLTLLDGLCEYEAVIVNDGSNDSQTLAFLDTWQRNKPAHHVYISQTNKGLPGARNSAIQAAQGKFILPLDSDDTLHPEIHHFIRHLQNQHDTGILFGNYQTFGDEEKSYYLNDHFSPTELLLFHNRLTACSFFPKALWQQIGGYDESFKTFEDYEFWCRCALNGASFTHLPKMLFRYRKIYNGQSLLQRSKPMHQEYRQKIASKLVSPHIDPAEITRISNELLKTQIKQKKKKAFALFCYAFCPPLFRFLCKIKVFRFKDQFIQ